MDKRQFFIEAIQARVYTKRDWVLTLFAVVSDLTYVPEKAYPYKIVTDNAGKDLFFVDPDDTQELIPLDGCKVGVAPFHVNERITLQPNDLMNVFKPVDTTYGAAVINAIVLIWPFGKKIEYMHDMRNGDKLDKLIVSKCVDYPANFLDGGRDKLNEMIKTINPNDPGIYPHELKRSSLAMSSLVSLAPIAAPAASPKTMQVDDAVLKRRDELIAEHAGHLHDPVIMANIVDELAKMDMATFKGDPAEGFFIKQKSFYIARMKAHIIYGLEYGFDKTSLTPSVITKSLSEGTDIATFPAQIDGSRAASHDRGSQTALAGAGVKELYRALQSVTISDKPCNTKLGLLVPVDVADMASLVGRYALDPNKLITFLVTEEIVKANSGKSIILRSPGLCSSPDESYCPYCVGVPHSKSPTGLHITASDILSIFMNDSMKSMHGKVQKTVRLNYRQIFT